MMSITDIMVNEHRELDMLFREFREIIFLDFKKAKSLFLDFREGMERHISLENDHLFKAFETRSGLNGNGPTAIMRAEHNRILELIEGIRIQLGESNTHIKEMETELSEIMDWHDIKEEGTLYPWLDNSLNQAEKEELLGKLRGDCLVKAA